MDRSSCGRLECKNDIYIYIWDYTLYILLKFLLTLEDIQDIPDSIDLANKSKYTD